MISRRSGAKREVRTFALVASCLVVSCPTTLHAEVVRWIRFEDPDAAGQATFGKLMGDVVHAVAGVPWESPQETGRTLPTGDLRPLIPTEPNHVLGGAYNFRSHLQGRSPPAEPQFFWKSPSSLAPHNAPIELPHDARNAHYEAELVIVLGRAVRHATLAQAERAIFGYTCGNDVSERTWQESDVQWWRAKSTATFGPVGPVIATGVDWRDLRIRGVHNGQVVQDESASDLLFSPAEMVQYASRYVDLQPGDLIFTGSPGNTQPLRSGDVFEVHIEPIGVLRNRVEQPTQAAGRLPAALAR